MAHVSREQERITPNEVKSMMDRGDPLTIVDVRAPDDYDSSPIKVMGALRIPPDEIEQRFQEVPREKRAVLYCSSPGEGISVRAATALIDKGYTDVYPLLGGFDEWLRRGLPIETK